MHDPPLLSTLYDVLTSFLGREKVGERAELMFVWERRGEDRRRRESSDLCVIG